MFERELTHHFATLSSATNINSQEKVLKDIFLGNNRAGFQLAGRERQVWACRNTKAYNAMLSDSQVFVYLGYSVAKPLCGRRGVFGGFRTFGWFIRTYSRALCQRVEKRLVKEVGALSALF